MKHACRTRRRGDGGNAYPLEPGDPRPNVVVGRSRGHVGMGLNAVCMAGIYQKLAADMMDDEAALQGARCFMEVRRARSCRAATAHSCVSNSRSSRMLLWADTFEHVLGLMARDCAVGLVALACSCEVWCRGRLRSR